jgi:hypothetical protein
VNEEVVMRGSVFWALGIGVLIGGALGAAAMSGLLLPIQINLQQEQLKAMQTRDYLLDEQRQNEQMLEKKESERLKAVEQQQKLAKENARLKLQLDDAARRIADAENKLRLKKP